MDYLVKVIIFVPFLGLVYLVIDYFKTFLTAAMASVPYTSYLCQFGIMDGLSIYFTLIVSAFSAKQILNFIK